jgi:TIR domain/Domain of unknown function (DUF4384)
MSDLFISYSRLDRGRIEVLAQLLERMGWSVWWDRQIVVGEAFDKVIEHALAEARIVLVAWSEHSVDSDWVRAEASFAIEQNKLVPIALDHAPWPVRFRTTHTLDLSDWDGAPDHPACTRLLADLEERLGPPGNPRTMASGAAKGDARADYRTPPMVRGSAGALATAMGPSVGAAAAAAPGLGWGAWVGIGAGGVLALLVAAHIAYPRPILAAFGANTEAIRATVAQRLKPLRCATVEPAVSQDWMFRVNVALEGDVSSKDDIAAAAGLARVPQVSSVSNSLSVEPWPFCDVINLVAVIAPAMGKVVPPAIASDHPDMVFKDGDRIVLKVTSASIDGHLYVDYIDEDGTVAHMVPNPRHPNDSVEAGATVTVGAAAGEKTSEPAYEVSAPFGKRMILATTSRAPLFDTPRNQIETAASYLASLRNALAMERNVDPESAVSAYRFITTEPKKE